MYQTINMVFGDTHENTKAGYRAHHPFKGFAHVVLHKLAFEPVADVTGSIIGTAFSHGALFA